MRKVSGATVATILAIALYFTLFWGFDALRMLTSPTYGLEEVWRSQYRFRHRPSVRPWPARADQARGLLRRRQTRGRRLLRLCTSSTASAA